MVAGPTSGKEMNQDTTADATNSDRGDEVLDLDQTEGQLLQSAAATNKETEVIDADMHTCKLPPEPYSSNYGNGMRALLIAWSWPFTSCYLLFCGNQPWQTRARQL